MSGGWWWGVWSLTTASIVCHRPRRPPPSCTWARPPCRLASPPEPTMATTGLPPPTPPCTVPAPSTPPAPAALSAPAPPNAEQMPTMAGAATAALAPALLARLPTAGPTPTARLRAAAAARAGRARGVLTAHPAMVERAAGAAPRGTTRLGEPAQRAAPVRVAAAARQAPLPPLTAVSVRGAVQLQQRPSQQLHSKPVTLLKVPWSLWRHACAAAVVPHVAACPLNACSC